jgi:DNA-binding response OmpR family regulator
MRHKNTVISRETLIENIWSEDQMPTETTVDVYIRRIRSLLGTQKQNIKTIRGYGYMIKE